MKDKKNRVYDRYYDRARALGLKYSRIDIYKTRDGLNFVVVKLENNPPTGQILRFLKEYGPEDVVLEFAVVIRPSLNYSLYNIGRRELQFKVLKNELVSYGMHESEALAVPATGLVIKRAGALTYRRVLLINEFITILEEKEIGLGFNEISGMRSKSMSNLKRFMRDLSEIIEFYTTFGVKDTKHVRDGKIYERYVEVYKYYRVFRKEVLEDQILSCDLFMDLVFKKGITIDMIKIWTEQMEIKELKRAVYEIKEQEIIYEDEDIEILILELFWGLWKKSPNKKFLKKEKIREYCKIDGITPELLLYLKVFKGIDIYNFYTEKFRETDFGNDSSVSRLVGHFINTYYNYFKGGFDMLYEFSLLNRSEYESIQEMLENKDKVKEFFKKFVKKVAEVYEKEHKDNRFEMLSLEMESDVLSTHIIELDNIIGGGFRCGSVYEFQFNDFGVMSRFLHYLMVALQFKKRKYGTYLKLRDNPNILMIETGRYFDLRTLKRVIKSLRREKELPETNIILLELHNLKSLEDAAMKIEEIVKEYKISAVIINRLSDIAFTSSEIPENKEEKWEYYDKRNRTINKVINVLRTQGYKRGFTSIIVNRVKKDSEIKSSISGKIIFNKILRIEKTELENDKKVGRDRTIRMRYKEAAEAKVMEVYLKEERCRYRGVEEELIIKNKIEKKFKFGKNPKNK